MLNTKFDAWCNAATVRIRYWQDRDAVSAELRAHLEDRYDALIESGLSRTEATAKALEAMGDAKVIAPQLGKIHSPWLGWLLGLVRLVGITVLVCAFVFVYYAGINALVIWSDREDEETDLCSLVDAEDITYYDTPNARSRLEGYDFCVTEVAVAPADRFMLESRLYVMLEVSWLPWSQGFGQQEYIWAVDSQGNDYECGAAGYYYDDDVPNLVTWGGYNRGVGKISYVIVVCGFNQDAQWIELRYDRDGREMTLRIDLTGGGAG